MRKGKQSLIKSVETNDDFRQEITSPSFLPLFFDFSTAPVSMTFNWQTSSIESRLSFSSSFP